MSTVLSPDQDVVKIVVTPLAKQGEIGGIEKWQFCQ
jgi:hypothetical protein